MTRAEQDGLQVGITHPADRLDELPRVEELGFDSVWTSEHMLFYGPTSDATVTLGAFAAKTKSIAIGTAVLLLPLRSATVTAKAISTVDIISGGRVLLGIGVGGEFPKEFEATGVPLNERGARTNEAIRVLRQLWSEDHTSFHGRWTSFEDATMQPKPAQPGGPPIIVAGRSEAAMRRAGRLGDGYMPYLITPDRYTAAKRMIEQVAEQHGRTLEGFHWVLYQFISIASTYKEAHERAVGHLSRQYNQDFSGIADRYAAVGTAEQARERLLAFAAAGVRHFILVPISAGGDEADDLVMFANEIMPALKRG